jgi:hypothetical protein
MRRDYKFNIGERVYIIPAEYYPRTYGVVVDTTSHSVFIKWEDQKTPCEMFQDRYCDITVTHTKNR